LISFIATIVYIVPHNKETAGTLFRFGVSIEENLLDRFDTLIAQKGYNNRSEALRDLIRDALVREEALTDIPVAGSLTMVYNHHAHDITHKLTHFQHEFGDLIIATLHVHLSHDDCMEVIALKGPGSRLKQMSDALLGMKGVKHGKLVITSTKT